MERLPRALRAPFTVDLRALGLLRIAVAGPLSSRTSYCAAATG